MLTAIDYGKAFNRMEYQECLKSFARHGAPTQLISLIATFLSGRVMTVRVGNSWSKPRPVNGGVPQGSILGVLLFNLTTDNLEDQQGATGYGGRLEPTVSPFRTPGLSPTHETAGTPRQLQAGPLSQSTPAAMQTLFEPGITPFRKGDTQFVFLDKARNVRRALDLDRTQLRDRTIPHKPNPQTSAVWKDRDPETNKFVDDGLVDCKVDMENVTPVDVGGVLTKDKHAIAAQNVFKRIIHNAESIGMCVNAVKTAQICISDVQSYEAAAHIYTKEGVKITSGQHLKLLGYHFNNRPTCTAHIESIRKKVRDF